MITTKFDRKIKLGIVNDEPIYLSPPSWDCGWYWGFGYLGNKNCHYHVYGMNKDKNLYDAFKEHFGESFKIKDDNDLWTLSELFATFYTLKETCEVLGRGGSHLSTNPLTELIINKSEVKRINEKVMPEIFDKIYELLTK